MKNIYTIKFRIPEPFELEYSEMIEESNVLDVIELARLLAKKRKHELLGVFQSYLSTKKN